MEKEEEGKLEAILNAAQRMFGQYGLTKTTMTDIAKEVGMGKASLYYYFPTIKKSHILSSFSSIKIFLNFFQTKLF